MADIVARYDNVVRPGGIGTENRNKFASNMMFRADSALPKLSDDLILPVVVQYLTIFILLEYR